MERIYIDKLRSRTSSSKNQIFRSYADDEERADETRVACEIIRQFRIQGRLHLGTDTDGRAA